MFIKNGSVLKAPSTVNTIKLHRNKSPYLTRSLNVAREKNSVSAVKKTLLTRFNAAPYTDQL